MLQQSPLALALSNSQKSLQVTAGGTQWPLRGDDSPAGDGPLPTPDIFMSDSLWDDSFFVIDPDEYYAMHYNNCGVISEVPAVTDNSDSFGTQHVAPFDLEITHSYPLVQERDHEMAFLVRHFTEVIGPW